MLLQEFSIRIFLVYSIQSIMLGMFLFFIVVILRKNRTRLSFLLSSYFSFFVAGLVIDVVATIYLVTPLSLFLYVSAVYVIYLSLGWLVLFTLFLVYRKAWKYGLAYISVYAVLSLILCSMPNGMQYSASTNWIPIWSLEFFFWGVIFFSLFVVCPEVFLSFKLYRITQHAMVKRKLRVLLIGIAMNLASIYLIGVYNAFPENTVFRAVWSVITFILIPLSGLMIYLGIGKNLE